MRKLVAMALAVATLAGVGTLPTHAQAQPRFWNGHRYCWERGWHGPGWYWCGYGVRQGYGWGGGGGWNGWGGGVAVGIGPVGVAIGGGPGPGPGRVWGGHRYCWERGWHGPGWYWCGYGARQGYGWGGGRGWNNW